jgi:hypothetical protein
VVLLGVHGCQRACRWCAQQSSVLGACDVDAGKFTPVDKQYLKPAQVEEMLRLPVAPKEVQSRVRVLPPKCGSCRSCRSCQLLTCCWCPTQVWQVSIRRLRMWSQVRRACRVMCTRCALIRDRGDGVVQGPPDATGAPSVVRPYCIILSNLYPMSASLRVTRIVLVALPRCARARRSRRRRRSVLSTCVSCAVFRPHV